MTRNRLADYCAHILFTQGINNAIFCKPGLNKSPPGNLTCQKPVPFRGMLSLYIHLRSTSDTNCYYSSSAEWYSLVSYYLRRLQQQAKVIPTSMNQLLTYYIRGGPEQTVPIIIPPFCNFFGDQSSSTMSTENNLDPILRGYCSTLLISG